MRWGGRRESSNIEDRRGLRIAGGPAVGGVGGLVVLLVALYLGIDPAVLNQAVGAGGRQAAEVPYEESSDEAVVRERVAVVLADTEQAWGEIFRATGREYREPTLVLFSEAVESACGFAQAAVGPFYCPADQKVYIDLAFYDELDRRFGAPGDFAQAYVIAHEIGHHVQTLLGTAGRQGSGDGEGSVRTELQADCYAGLWARSADRSRQLLESGDVEEGLAAASAIGDDRLQMQAQGYVTPESFTHGSSEQRVRWFRRGLEASSLEDCDTFKARAL
jgi:uncharacterized protein